MIKQAKVLIGVVIICSLATAFYSTLYANHAERQVNELRKSIEASRKTIIRIDSINHLFKVRLDSINTRMKAEYFHGIQ